MKFFRLCLLHEALYLPIPMGEIQIPNSRRSFHWVKDGLPLLSKAKVADVILPSTFMLLVAVLILINDTFSSIETRAEGGRCDQGTRERAWQE